jgi:hypothetical protein
MRLLGSGPHLCEVGKKEDLEGVVSQSQKESGCGMRMRDGRVIEVW